MLARRNELPAARLAGAERRFGAAEDASPDPFVLLAPVGGVGGTGDDEVFVTMRAQLFGPDAAEVAARERERWSAWFAEHVPAAR